MRILVISDIHAFVPDTSDNGFMHLRIKTGSPDSIDLTFEKMVAKGSFSEVGLIICPGDLGGLQRNPLAAN